MDDDAEIKKLKADESKAWQNTEATLEVQKRRRLIRLAGLGALILLAAALVLIAGFFPDDPAAESSFPLPDEVQNVQRSFKSVQDGRETRIGEESVDFETSLSLDTLMAFYREEFIDAGLREKEDWARIEPNSFALFFEDEQGMVIVRAEEATATDADGGSASVRHVVIFAPPTPTPYVPPPDSN